MLCYNMHRIYTEQCHDVVSSSLIDEHWITNLVRPITTTSLKCKRQYLVCGNDDENILTHSMAKTITFSGLQ